MSGKVRHPPLFSVILCTYNRAHLLPRALDSLFRQKETDWEVVIVDDGSTDNTVEVLQPFLRHKSRVKFVSHPNQGLARSRNIAAKVATGHFITFLDSDDVYALDHLSARRKAIEQNLAISFFMGGTEIIGEPYVADKHDPTRLIHLEECVIDATFVIRRELFLELGGFPELPFSAGSALYERALEAGVTIQRVDAPTYVYDRTTGDSICTLVSQGGIKAIEAFRNKGK